MSAQALQYQLQTFLGSGNPLLVYYDFSRSGVFASQSGSVWQSYLRNSLPTPVRGIYDGKIVGATGSTSGVAVNAATGAGNFLSEGTGDFTKNCVQVSGSSSLNLKNCSYLFLIESELRNDGVIMGSFEKITESAGGSPVISSKGFNFGINSRGKNFVQSLGPNGEFCFVNQNDELSKRNIVGLNFSNSEASIFRFDYLNNKIYSESFVCDASKIKNSENLYLGSSPSYWRAGQKLFSGKIEEFAVISGQIPQNILFELGKGFLSDYSFSSGAVTTTGTLSGFVPTIIYKTGITGAYASITGYQTIKSGIDKFSQSLLATGSIPIKEGDRYFKNYSDYLEQQGFLSGVNQNTYSPTGENASGTLGLQIGSGNVTGYQISTTYPYATTQIPLYKLNYLYGTTNEISGVVNTPVYTTNYITGSSSSGIVFSDPFEGFTKNFIYYLGSR